MASPRLRLGISGCGGIARYIFNECIGLECIQPVAAYDPNRANLAKFQEITSCEAVESYEALIGRKDIDAVVLAAPPVDRVPQVLPAAQAGKAIFSEKPLALSVAEGKRLVDGCHAAGVPLMVGQVLRFFGGFGRMAKFIQEGDFGKPLALQSNRLGTPFPSGTAMIGASNKPRPAVFCTRSMCMSSTFPVSCAVSLYVSPVNRAGLDVIRKLISRISSLGPSNSTPARWVSTTSPRSQPTMRSFSRSSWRKARLGRPSARPLCSVGTRNQS